MSTDPSPPAHLVRCILLAVALLAAGCGKRDGNLTWWQGEQQRLELSHQVALKQFRLQHLESADFAELEKLRVANQLSAASLKSLKLKYSALIEESEEMRRNLADFRESSIRDQRNRAIGRSFARLATVSGRTYLDVTVAAIDDAGVAIRHADGTARLKFDELDSGLQLLFGLDAELSVAAVQKESRDLATYDRWVDRQMEVQRERSEQIAADEARARQLADTDRIRLASIQLASARVNPLSQPATSFGSGASRFYSSYGNYYRRSNYRYVYYTPTYSAASFPRGCRASVNPVTVFMQVGKKPVSTIPPPHPLHEVAFPFPSPRHHGRACLRVLR